MNPRFKTHWHSAFTEQELKVFLSLINQVYAEIALLPEDAAALDNLIACVRETRWERRIDHKRNSNPCFALARAIGDAINDPFWRRCLAEIEVEVNCPA